MSDPLSYVRYSDSVEQKQPNEDETVAEILSVFDKIRVAAFEKTRHAQRDAHAKSHGILRGELTILENLPEPFAQGIARTPRTYPVIVRVSTAPGSIQPDGVSGFRGLAIKLVGVEGKKVLEVDPDALTQDFLFINNPVLPTGDVAAYLKEQTLLQKMSEAPDIVQEGLTAVARTVTRVADAVGLHPPKDASGTNSPEYHPLGVTYQTGAPIRWGDYMARVAVVPSSYSLQPLKDSVVNTVGNPSALRDAVVEFFHTHSAEWDFKIQLNTNLETMPIEDVSVNWPEEESPHVTIAKLTIPAQEAFSPARRVYADDTLTFNPWHALPEHRPLGSIQRSRKAAYEVSTQYRHKMNAAPLKEPTSIDELPD